MSTFFESVPNETLEFQIKKILPQRGFFGFGFLDLFFWILDFSKGTENPFLDSKS